MDSFTAKTFCSKKVFAVTLQTETDCIEVKEEHIKENLRKQIVETALELFFSKGIKEVKMDDIASLLSVSKRTIYELFTDKEQLLLKALKLHQERLREEVKTIIRQKTLSTESTLEIILAFYSLYFNLLKNINKNFFLELEKYPNIFKRNKDREARNDKKFIAWMEMGRKQGIFRQDANFEVLSFILRQNLKTIFRVNMQNNGNNELSKYSPEELGRSLVLFYLRGISTAKGQEIIEEYLKNEKQYISYES